ncbi:hypothetical protein BDV40DRAFT_294861 [Aspergillus tamarii]|uniref:Aflatoxin regulatory protein domain-containing protein n=1 Tax=Aspergillus tamarii TaxID=41984 RepID=A0A5N6VBC3_ASPTM|nr:hypothetical protein BDV40DRAFT_294861 [Aspergillus tamarii]
MVGRAPKKQRTRGTQSLPPWTSSHNSLTHPLSWGNISSNDSAALFTLGDFAADINGNPSQSYLNNFCFATTDLQPSGNPDSENVNAMATSNSQATVQGSAPNTSYTPYEATPSLMLAQLPAPSARSQLPDSVALNTPKPYRDRSVVSQYPHAAILMETVELLECHLQNPGPPIDQAMLLNRQAMVTVRDILGSHEFQRCQSCPSLVATIMGLAVGLYEIIFITIIRPATTTHGESIPESSLSESAPSAPGVRAVPAFRFGSLEFGPDEQEIFRNAIVRRDLAHCIETIRHCRQEIYQRQQLGEQQDRTAIQDGGFQSTKLCIDRIQLQWYKELEEQTVRLFASVPDPFPVGLGSLDAKYKLSEPLGSLGEDADTVQ